MLIDTHCHLFDEYYENIGEIIKNMDGIMITSGCGDKTNKEVIELVNKYPNVYGTLGIHPEEINNITDESFKIIEENINNPKILAIGEIGLDYYWVKDNKDEQIKLFKKQLELAKKYNKPVVIHSRDSIQDTYNILKEYQLKGTIHCFSSNLEMAKEFVKLGYKIGIGGILTFNNSKKLQDIVKELNLSDILLETDSPYLTPEPHRKERNQPSFVYYIAKKISELKNINIEEVINQTGVNAAKLFDLDI